MIHIMRLLFFSGVFWLGQHYWDLIIEYGEIFISIGLASLVVICYSLIEKRETKKDDNKHIRGDS